MRKRKKIINLVFYNEKQLSFLKEYQKFLGLGNKTATINFIINEQMKKFYDKGVKNEDKK